MSVVSIEGPMTTNTADGPDSVIGRWFMADTHGFVLFYRPGLDIAMVVEALDLQKLPDAPEYPSVQYHWECERMDTIRAGVRSRLEAEGFDPEDLRQISRN